MASDQDRVASVRRSRRATPFFRSKFTAPRTPHHVVRRDRLIGLLDDLREYPVTAIVAPAGAGKTALAADWVREGCDRAAWLTLDESDSEPTQFWAALTAALDDLVPGVAARVGAVQHDPDDLGAALRVLADDLALVDPGQCVLVLDDLHRIEGDETTRAMLWAFVENKPAWLHLLLLSRRRPPLPVDRMRAAGTLADVGFDVLRFTDDEAVAVLEALCPDVPDAAVGPVVRRADGWAAALQLAALAIRSQGRSPGSWTGEQSEADGSGSDRLVDDYVWHEVLRAEPAEVIDLLLSISVVDRVSYGLAEALTGRRDAGDLLEEAETRGLFVTRLDAGGWFEVHGLVRDFLTAEFRRRSPADLRERHARAARWFTSVDDGATALDHWLAAGEPASALVLLSDLAPGLFNAGRGALITRVLDQIPADVAHADDDALLRLAWCRMFVDRPGFGEALAAVDAATVARSDEATRGRLDVLRAVAAFLDGDWSRSELEESAAQHPPVGRDRTDPIPGYGWGVVARVVALDERWDDDGSVVGRVRTSAGADAARRIEFEGTRAVGLALAGHPLDALRASAGVRRLAESAGTQTLRTELGLADALVALEIGDRAQARAGFEEVAGRAAYPLSFARLLAELRLVELAIGDGRLDDAARTLGVAEATCREQLGLREFGGAGSASLLARTGTALALAQDDVESAARWAQRVNDPFWGPLGLARVSLAGGELEPAVAALARAEPRCTRHQVVGELLGARLLAGTDREASVKAVTAAIETAAEHGMLDTVATWGAGLVESIELAAWRVPDGWMQRLRRAMAVGIDERIEDGLAEHLTSREREVLRLLPTRLTHREIAAELFVSPNTLKFHLRLIYRKLGVSSRADAVERARDLRLLRRA